MGCVTFGVLSLCLVVDLGCARNGKGFDHSGEPPELVVDVVAAPRQRLDLGPSTLGDLTGLGADVLCFGASLEQKLGGLGTRGLGLFVSVALQRLDGRHRTLTDHPGTGFSLTQSQARALQLSGRGLLGLVAGPAGFVCCRLAHLGGFLTSVTEDLLGVSPDAGGDNFRLGNDLPSLFVRRSQSGGDLIIGGCPLLSQALGMPGTQLGQLGFRGRPQLGHGLLGPGQMRGRFDVLRFRALAGFSSRGFACGRCGLIRVPDRLPRLFLLLCQRLSGPSALTIERLPLLLDHRVGGGPQRDRIGVGLLQQPGALRTRCGTLLFRGGQLCRAGGGGFVDQTPGFGDSCGQPRLRIGQRFRLHSLGSDPGALGQLGCGSVGGAGQQRRLSGGVLQQGRRVGTGAVKDGLGMGGRLLGGRLGLASLFGPTLAELLVLRRIGPGCFGTGLGLGDQPVGECLGLRNQSGGMLSDGFSALGNHGRLSSSTSAGGRPAVACGGRHPRLAEH